MATTTSQLNSNLITQFTLLETRICGANFMIHPIMVALDSFLVVCALNHAICMPVWLK
jgi:hypothetical protein